MTKRLYDYDSHIKEFEATVIAYEKTNDEKFAIELSKTAFFPGGGGQECDEGEINGIKVAGFFEKEGKVYHILSKKNEKIDIGKKVTGKINFEKRFVNMQAHSAEHIVTGLIHNLYGFDNVGFHMGSECITLDVNGDMTEEMLKEAERLSNKVIYENVDITVSYPNNDELKNIDYRSKLELTENVRIVTIEGYDKCACCAPHVKKTGEIGIIKLLGAEKLKDKTRISMLSGYDAYYDYVKKFENLKGISNLLSVKPNESYEAVKKLHKELADKNFELVGLKREILNFKYRDYKNRERNGNIVVFEDNADMGELIYIANILSENNFSYISVLSSKKDGSGFNYVIKHNTLNLREKAKELNSILSGRGGGSGQMIQGFFGADKKDIEKVLTNL